MEIRETLKNDIDSFVSNASILHNIDGIVKKNEYFDLDKRISNLTKNDFESEERYNFFLTFINQDERQVDRTELKNLFRGDYLDVKPFLWMCEYLNRVAGRLK
jgi:hypothetical protein